MRITIVVTLFICSMKIFANNFKIAVIPKEISHSFWMDVEKGARKEAKKHNVQLIFRGPTSEDDSEPQTRIMEIYAKNKGIDAIVLAPVDKDKLRPLVEMAKLSGKKIVIIDSAVAGDQYDSFIATDNFAAGKKACSELKNLIPYNGRVLIVKFKKGNSSTDLREDGCEDAFKKSKIDVINDFYGSPTTGATYRLITNKINKLRAENKQIDGIFTSAQVSTEGAIKALKELGLSQTVRFVGFDSSEIIDAAIKTGDMSGTLVQRPKLMGELGVLKAVKLLKGEEVSKRVIVDVKYINRSNIK